MIKRSQVLIAAHCLVDILQDMGSGEDYYKINNATDRDFQTLARAIAIWCQLHNVEIDEK